MGVSDPQNLWTNQFRSHTGGELLVVNLFVLE